MMFERLTFPVRTQRMALSGFQSGSPQRPAQFDRLARGRASLDETGDGSSCQTRSPFKKTYGHRRIQTRFDQRSTEELLAKIDTTTTTN